VFAAEDENAKKVRLSASEAMARLYTLHRKAFRALLDGTHLRSAVMSLIARILGVSLITSAIVAGAGFFLLWSLPEPSMGATVVGQIPPDMPARDYTAPIFILACVGGLIGAVAGAAQEIVSAQRSKAPNRIDVG
jgi:Na+/H+-translocating membrane pyrophosphatase